MSDRFNEVAEDKITASPRIQKESGEPRSLVYPNVKFFLAGIVFGILLIKGEVVSWFRIQEMFRFESFHMFGVMLSAIMVGMSSILLIKKFKIRTMNKE